VRVGYANLVTGFRLLLVALIASTMGGPPSTAIAWSVIVVSTVAALLDIADGQIARRTGTSTPFGARFDMEVDALLILVLSLLVWRYGKAGSWVVASGLLRYAFVAAGWLLPWLSQPLPPSMRRKTICVVQIVVLIVALGPVIPRWLSVASTAVALALLTWSFASDTAWLWRHARRTTTRVPASPSLS
jgi:phosphatidylglycerophosphate synthase